MSGAEKSTQEYIIEHSQLELGQQLAAIPQDRRFYDVTLIAKDLKIEAHKIVLADASIKFRRLLKNLDSSELQIDDLKPSILSQIVDFLYTGQIKEPSVKNLRRLALAALHYGIEHLVQACDKFLFSYVIRDENAISWDILVFAHEIAWEELEHKIVKHLAEDYFWMDIIENDFIINNVNVCNKIFNKYIETIGDIESILPNYMEPRRKRARTVDRDRTNNNYEKFFSEMNYPDFIFKVGGKRIHAHKGILASRSDVFAAMFSFVDKEKQQNVAEIVDFGYEVFYEFLRYIYCENVENMGDHALELLKLAEKYNVSVLKEYSMKYLMENMNCAIWSVAILYDSELEERALKFVQCHLSEMIYEDKWKSFIEANPNLFVKILKWFVDLKAYDYSFRTLPTVQQIAK